MPVPAIGGGSQPPVHSRRVITRANGERLEAGRGEFYVLKKGDTLACFPQGGCGVGDPLDRPVEKVSQDVLDDYVSVEKAREIYGVVIDPETFKVDEKLTQELRHEKKSHNKSDITTE